MPAPTRLGKYELRRELGKGSMGVVYEAFDPVIERLVAIKFIRQDELGAAQTAELITRLRREAQAAGRLNHPGIVSVYDFGEDATVGGSGIAYIAMELVEGRELRDLLDSGRRFTPAESVGILGEVLGALQHAHDRGVTHRDIKPGNVILLAGGGVKLADFGVARIERSELTQAGTLIGTPMYMSPEQILGLEVDGRSDLFSCGVLLYELLTGRKPFTGSVTTVIQQVLHVEPEPPSRANTALGADWDRLLQRALAKKPEQRFASAREFAQALRDTLARHHDDATVVMAPPPPSAQFAPVAPVAPTPAVRPATPATARPSRRGSTALAAGVIALAGAAGLFMLLRPAPRQGPEQQVAIAPAASGSGAPAPAPEPTPAPPPMAAPVPTTAPLPPALPTAPPARASATPPATAPAPAPAPASVATAPPRAQEAASRPAPGPAPRPAALPTSAPAPRPAAAPATPSAPPAPPPAAPPASAPASEWPARLARVDKLKPDLTLTQALRRLLEPMPPSDRQTMAEFEALMGRQAPTVGLAMGIKNGYFHYGWVRGAHNAAAASAAARSRCQERHGTTCHAVLVGGTLQPEGFAAAARALGAQPPEAVRHALLQAFALSIVTARQAQAASAPGAPASATPASRPPAAASAPRPLPRTSGAAPPVAGSAPTAPPAIGWPTARAKLRGPAAPQDLAGALAVLLQVDNPADQAVLARLQGFTRRQPWNSAVAMGIRNGFISWHASSGEKRADWAREQALSRCAASAQPPCVVVATNGEPQLDAVRELAARLGTRPQAEVREALLNNLRRHLP
jgi:tRNA A-37 threonylcarbamoyl transferase component Bud32